MCPLCFFYQVLKVLRDFVEFEAALEEIAVSDERSRVALRELRDQELVFFTRGEREPSVSVEVFLRGEKEKSGRIHFKK